MKIRRLASIWCSVGVISSCLQSASAQGVSFDKAIDYLKSSHPMNSPDIELHFTDPARRKAAQDLYRAQLNMLGHLSDCRDSSVIPTIIPYLNYTPDGNPLEEETIEPKSYIPDLKLLCAQQPVFAIILHIPGADESLVHYISDPKNPLRLRIAAFHVLRYVSQSMFNATADKINKELARAGPTAAAYLKAIEDGSAPFEGIFPIDAAQ